MGKDNGINFNQKFTTYLSQNIKLDDLFNEKDKDKFKQSFSSIFNNFDSQNKDGELDVNEVNNIINVFDLNKDKNISEDEIQAYCEANGVDKKFINAFLQRINAYLPTQVSKTKDTSCPKNYCGPAQKWYNISSTRYGNDFVKYDTTVEHALKAIHKNSAIYDITNDKLLPANSNNKIEIVGVKSFQDLAFEGGVFKKDNEKAFENFPKIVIKQENGEDIKIDLRIRDIDMSVMKDENDYMFLMTNLTNAIAELPPNVLEDLKQNVSCINLKKISQGRAGEAGSLGDTLGDYTEFVSLDVPNGLVDNTSTLTHEIAHTVDNGIGGYATNDNQVKLSEFIDNIKKSDLSYKLKSAYALKDPQELFAEYYTYTNLQDKGGSNLKESNQLFALLDRSLNNGDQYGWAEIKTILDSVKDKSKLNTEKYVQKAEADDEYFANLNSEKGSIPKDRMSLYNVDVLWDAYNTDDVRGVFEKVLKNFPENAAKYKQGTREEQLDIVNSMRNHPDFKQVLENCFNKIDAEIIVSNRFQNLPFKDALFEVEKNFNAEQKQKLKKDQVSAKIDADSGVLSSPELREVLVEICSNSKLIPKSIRDRFGEGSTEPITKEIVLALRNEPSMWYFLIFEKNYFKHG